jgi:hypothetical protein
MILTHLMLFGFFEPTSLAYQRASRGVEAGCNRGLL